MRYCNWLILFLSIAAPAADKETFRVGPAESYSHRATGEKITIAAEPFETAEKTRPVFGKEDPNKHGVLPVLIVIKNDSEKALRLEGMRVEYIDQNRNTLEATPAQDVPYLGGVSRPRMIDNPIPTGAPKMSTKKSKLNALEIQTRAFAAKMLPPGDSAGGFFYYQTGFSSSARIYVTGIREAGSNRELFYLEIPFR
jgi:hypothetical protein